MRLYELPDQELDSIFKKAAEEAEYPFNESAWEGFMTRLNRWDRFRPAFWRITGGMVIVLLGLITLLISKSPQTTPPGVSGSTTGELEQSDQGFQKSGISNDFGNRPGETALEESMPLNQRNQRKMEEPSSGETTEISESETGERVEENYRIIEEKSGVSTISSGNFSSAPAERSGSHVGEEGGNLKYGQVGENENLTRIVEAGSGRDGSIMGYQVELEKWDGRLTGRGLPASTGTISPERNPEESYSINETLPPEKKQQRLGYSLNFTLGPDFSGVGANSYGTGTFVGLGIELYLLKNLSIMMGVSHSRKKYAVHDEYTAPYPGIWTYGQVPDQVDIACHVLDIPINVYYSIFKDGKNRIFAGAGLSSYLMLTEEYHFEYFDTYYSNLIQDYNIRNENQHYFGILNISAGYSRNINERWGWQLEPYFKLPIQDIAAAKVRLNSFGGFVTLKYRFR